MSAGDSAILSYPPAGDGAEPARLYLRIVEPAAGKLLLRPATPSGPSGQNPNTGVSKIVLRFEDVAEPLRLAVLLSPDLDIATAPDLPQALLRPLAEWPSNDRQAGR